ncbi:MAG: DbpA RNA binding domain-containing protein, partial [Planctomycetota bacterium]
RPTTQDVFNYNDTFLILLAQKAISYYKLAIKVPNIMEEKEIHQIGTIEVQDRLSYVAVAQAVARRAVKQLNAGRIKNKRFRATLVGGGDRPRLES